MTRKLRTCKKVTSTTREATRGGGEERMRVRNDRKHFVFSSFLHYVLESEVSCACWA